MAVSVETFVQDRLQCTADPVDPMPEICSGRLMLLASARAGTPQRPYLWVKVHLQPTSTGKFVVFWPDKAHAAPLGCFNLRDSRVSQSVDRKLAFTFRPRDSCDDDLPLTLVCQTQSEFEQWKRALAEPPRSTGPKKYTATVNRLPCLPEEEP